jgi:CRP/FNR family transcriptional regulator
MIVLDERRGVSMQSKTFALLKNLTLFAKLPIEDVKRFVDASQTTSHKRGKILYLEGQSADCFYVICTGWLKIFRTTKEGEEVILTMLTKGSVVGDNAIFGHGRYVSSVQVVEDAQIVSIPFSLLEEQLRVSNQFAFNMMTSMMQYQRLHELQLEQYLLYSAPQRIGCFLLGLCPKLEQKDGVVIELPYGKTLIAWACHEKTEHRNCVIH